jgi:hypothetical protein
MRDEEREYTSNEKHPHALRRLTATEQGFQLADSTFLTCQLIGG